MFVKWELQRWNQDTEFKRTIINFITEFKGCKEDTKKQFNEIKEKELQGE